MKIALLTLTDSQINRIQEEMRDRWYMLVDADRVDTMVRDMLELLAEELNREE